MPYTASPPERRSIRTESDARAASPVLGREGVVVTVVVTDPEHDWPVIVLYPLVERQPGKSATPFETTTELIVLQDRPVVELYPAFEVHPAM